MMSDLLAVIRRAGFTRTIWASRQMVVHGHVRVNGKKVDRPSYSVEPGDVVTLAVRPFFRSVSPSPPATWTRPSTSAASTTTCRSRAAASIRSSARSTNRESMHRTIR